MKMVTRTDVPLVVEGTEHFVERNYRESGRHQWVRETLVNAIEAGATRIDFGTEWQGVEIGQTYRRTIADNGTGMTPDELVGFFRTYGGSGKPIGGLHENYGIGAKSSLFPWNRAGVVIVSWHSDYTDPSMIWVRKNPTNGSYGLRTWDTPDGGELVIVAGEDDELGIDWSLVRPDWIDTHGTVLVLLGDDLEQDTVLGDIEKGEGGVPGVGIGTYLNRRMWDLNDLEVTVDEYRGDDKRSWPRSASTTRGGELQRASRRLRGAKYYIDYPPAHRGGGSIAAADTLRLSDGTEIDWYLWEGAGRDGIRNAAQNGFICAKYSPDRVQQILTATTPEEVFGVRRDMLPELFDVTDHPSRFRSFGISETDVRKRLWLVARPPLAGPKAQGVYMSSDRNRLLIQGGAHAGDSLGWEDWAIQFADNLPKPIVDAINEARAGKSETELEEAWRQRLADRFARRWRQIRLFLDDDGERMARAAGSTESSDRGMHRRPRRRSSSGNGNGNGRRGGGGGSSDNAGHAREPGPDTARERSAAVGLPQADWVKDEELFEPGIFAVWNPPSPANPSGLVQLNVEHPVFLEELRYWAPQYPQHLEDRVTEVIKAAYAQMAIAMVAHSESLRPVLPHRDDVDTKLRTPEALTTGLLGLVGASAIIGPSLGALGRRRPTGDR
jgi:hypothetical protein